VDSKKIATNDDWSLPKGKKVELQSVRNDDDHIVNWDPDTPWLIEYQIGIAKEILLRFNECTSAEFLKRILRMHLFENNSRLLLLHNVH